MQIIIEMLVIGMAGFGLGYWLGIKRGIEALNEIRKKIKK
tara:strand:- start:1002 stop:1121 length:120 start_codon:yes stop_codon:yes gene_type:complete